MRGKRVIKKRTQDTGQSIGSKKDDPRCTQCGEEVAPLEALLSPVCGRCVQKNHQRAVGK